MLKTLKKIPRRKFTPYKKRNYRDASNNRKLGGIRVLNAKRTILKRMDVPFTIPCLFGKYDTSHETFINIRRILEKIKISFIVYFCFGKYSFSVVSFWLQVAFWRRLMLHLLFISILVNTASVSIVLSKCDNDFITIYELYRWKDTSLWRNC